MSTTNGTKQRNPFRCYKCGSDNIRVSNDVVRRRRYTRKAGGSVSKEMVGCDCKNCGRQWYSNHPDAIAASRKQDRNLARRHGGQT